MNFRAILISSIFLLPGVAKAQSIRVLNNLIPNIAYLDPYGAGVNQTAGVFSVGFNYQCVMGGAENGQGPGGLGPYPTIDSVGLCAAAYGPPPLFSVPGTFDATHFYPATPLSPVQLSQLSNGVPGVNAGTWIQTTGGSTTYRGWITTATPTAISVIGWWVPGQNGYVTPSGILTAAFGVTTKVWGFNEVVSLDQNSFANSGEGNELDVINNRGASADFVGMDVVQLGAYGISGPAYDARGVWSDDYLARAGTEAGFTYDPTIDNVPVATIAGFTSKQNNGSAFAARPAKNGIITYSVDSITGDVRLGSEGGGVAGLPALFFYSSGSNTDDAFISASGGSGNQNTGTITYSAGIHAFVGGPIEVVNGTNYVYITSAGISINGQPSASCTGLPDANFQVVGGIITKC